MNDRAEGYDYGESVALQIARNDLPSYVKAARRVRSLHTSVEVVNIQHEYGLFGGEWGEYILEFYDTVRLPVVTTLHSVIPSPDATLRQVTRAIAERSTRVVVLAKAAINILTHDYGIDPSRVQMIPHGVPTVAKPVMAHRLAKQNLGYSARTVVSTFGLLSPNKGIEVALAALPEIVRAHPEVLYLIIGQTHPGVRASSGESYRDQLKGLVNDLGLGGHVAFVDRYLGLADLMEYLLATDIYIVPYLNPNQIVSGTLAYALGSGKAVISTPFIHAQEVLADGCGLLVPFCDSAAMTTALRTVLEEPEKRLAMEQQAYAISRNWIWPSVAAQYQAVFQEAARHELPTLKV